MHSANSVGAVVGDEEITRFAYLDAIRLFARLDFFKLASLGIEPTQHIGMLACEIQISIGMKYCGVRVTGADWEFLYGPVGGIESAYRPVTVSRVPDETLCVGNNRVRACRAR